MSDESREVGYDILRRSAMYDAKNLSLGFTSEIWPIKLDSAFQSVFLTGGFVYCGTPAKERERAKIRPGFQGVMIALDVERKVLGRILDRHLMAMCHSRIEILLKTPVIERKSLEGEKQHEKSLAVV